MKSLFTVGAILPTKTVVCGFSAGVTLGTAGLTTGGIMGRTPGIPSIGGRCIDGSIPIPLGGREGKPGRTIVGHGEG